MRSSNHSTCVLDTSPLEGGCADLGHLSGEYQTTLATLGSQVGGEASGCPVRLSPSATAVERPSPHQPFNEAKRGGCRRGLAFQGVHSTLAGSNKWLLPETGDPDRVIGTNALHSMEQRVHLGVAQNRARLFMEEREGQRQPPKVGPTQAQMLYRCCTGAAGLIPFVKPGKSIE